MTKTIVVFILAVASCFGQSLTANCSQSATLTSATAGASLNNRLGLSGGCNLWKLQYYSTGFTVISISLQGAPDNGSGAPGTWADVSSTFVQVGSNPLTGTGSGFVQVQNYYAWMRVNLGTATGSGSLKYDLKGFNSNVARGAAPAAAAAAAVPTVASSILQSLAKTFTFTLATLVNVTTGNIMVVAVNYFNGDVTPTLADTLSTTYTRRQIVTNSCKTAIFTGTLTSSGANTITLTDSGATSPLMAYAEVTGYTAFDASPAGSTTGISPVFATTAKNSLIISAYGGCADGSTGMPQAPAILIAGSNGNDSLAMGAYIQPAIGNTVAAWTTYPVTNVPNPGMVLTVLK